MSKVVDFLVERMAPTIRGAGANDDKAKPGIEVDICEEFAESISKGFFCLNNGVLHYFDGKRYVFCDNDDFYRIYVKVIKKLEIGKAYRQDATVNKVRKRIMGEDIKQFQSSKSIVSFKNGVLNLDSEVMHDHGQEFMTVTYLDFDYDPKATCPRWNQFLIEVLDEKQRMILQEFMGCIFIDRKKLKIETALYLFGNGSNGKGVVSETMEFMLGSTNISKADLSHICTGMHSDYHVASIDGKLLNFASDMGTEDFSNGRYKAIVSGEGVQAREPGGRPFTADNLPLLAASINHIPVITDNSNGFWRRFCMLVFDRTFSEEDMDKNLNQKLQGEVSGIFNWLMEGRRRLIANKGVFTQSDIVERAKQVARVDSDSVKNFLFEFYYFAKVKKDMKNPTVVRLSSKDIYNKYKTYCLETGFKPKGLKAFKDTLVRDGFQYKKSIMIDDVVTSGYQFYECKPSYEDLEKFDEPELSEDQIEAKKEEQKMNELPF